MRLEKLKDFLILLQALSAPLPITIKEIQPRMKFIAYPGILKNLKNWVASGYVKEIKLKGGELRLGGPKLKYRITRKGEQFRTLLGEILQKNSTPEAEKGSQQSKKSQNDKEELITEILVNISDDLKEKIMNLLEQDRPDKYLNDTITKIQYIIQNELEFKL